MTSGPVTAKARNPAGEQPVQPRVRQQGLRRAPRDGQLDRRREDRTGEQRGPADPDRTGDDQRSPTPVGGGGEQGRDGGTVGVAASQRNFLHGRCTNHVASVTCQ
ncbi:hypothetical protein GCM10027610_086140 [Dactylosporangium cerinum]